MLLITTILLLFSLSLTVLDSKILVSYSYYIVIVSRSELLTQHFIYIFTNDGNGHVVRLCILAFVDNVEIKLGTLISSLAPEFHSIHYTSRSGICGLYHSSILIVFTIMAVPVTFSPQCTKLRFSPIHNPQT